MMKKLLRITTADISLDLLKGQLHFLSDYYDVAAVASDTGRLGQFGNREGVRTINIPMKREISLLSDIKSLYLLWKLFLKEKPYIVHANTPKGSLLAMVAGFFAGVPNRLYTVTGLRYQGATGTMRMLLKTMERLTCLFATKVIPEGIGVQSTLTNDRITSKQLRVIANGNINGINTDYFSPEAVKSGKEEIRSQLNLQPDDFVFIFIGRIVKDKGMEELAASMRHMSKNYPYCKLILVGRFESELDPLSKENEDFLKNSPCVRFVGYKEDVRPYLYAADALVFPSYREGFPNVVLQAGAMGLPAIVTDINGCNEIIIDGENGRIIPPKSITCLIEMMEIFLTHPASVAYMASNARKMIALRYEQQNLWDAILNMYKEL